VLGIVDDTVQRGEDGGVRNRCRKGNENRDDEKMQKGVKGKYASHLHFG
jgi:hypothetical protein